MERSPLRLLNCGGGAAAMGSRILAFSALLLVQVSISGCGFSASDADVWGVIFTSLPEKVLVDNIDENAVTYIFTQTHEPLFRQEDGENFRSKILAGWARDINYTEYKFWPNTSLEFDAGARFTAENLRSFAEKITVKYGVPSKIFLDGDHVVVKFNTAQPGYLRFLTQYRNAPSITNGPAAEGLGAFAIKSISRTKIELERKKRVRNGYNRIILYAYGGPEDPNLQNRQISDFNKLSSFQWPAWIKSEYRGFDNIELRVVGLAINHPDAQIRKALYNCMDVDEFRKAAIPGRKDFYDIRTVLPVGAPGAKGGRPSQSCVVPKRIKGETILFANPRSDNGAELAAFAGKFNKKTGLRLVIKQYQPKEMNPMLFDRKHPRPYNLVVVVSDNPNREPEDFFTFYSGQDRAVDNVPAEILEKFRMLHAEGFSDKKNILAAQLAEKLGEEAIVLPLYQTTARLYYPRKIKNLSVGRGLLETPDVADLRW